MITLFGVSIDPTNVTGSIDTLIESQIKSKFPTASADFPHLNQAIEGNVALVDDVMNKYATQKVEAALGNFLTGLATKYPVIAPEINAIKAKIPTAL